MSFILDALKKSESDRQRQSGPALFEVKVAPRRTRLPPWAIAIAALLGVNLAIVTWMLVRHPARGDGGSPAPLARVDVVTPSAPQPVAGAAPAAASSGAPAAAAPAAVNSQSAAAPQTATPPAFAPASAPAAVAPANGGGSADDYVPATEPAAASSSHVRRGTADGVALYQDVAATPGARVPQLRLDLHVFAARPEDRFVMINMHKLREGESLPDGVHVDSITPDGAVLSYGGSKFLLPRE